METLIGTLIGTLTDPFKDPFEFLNEPPIGTHIPGAPPTRGRPMVKVGGSFLAKFMGFGSKGCGLRVLGFKGSRVKG